MSSLTNIKKGDVITADWLNAIVRELSRQLQPGWGSGLVSSGSGQLASQPQYLTAMFKAMEDFTAEEDVFKGDAKFWWRNTDDAEYQEHGDAVEVFSHNDDVAQDDVFAAFFNQQSGRWEKIGGGGACSEVDCLNVFGVVTGGSVTLTYVIDSQTDDIEIAFDDDAATVQAAYESHPGIGAGNVRVVGGPWPEVALHAIFSADLAGKTIEFPTVDDNITGGGSFRMWKASSANWKGYA